MVVKNGGRRNLLSNQMYKTTEPALAAFLLLCCISISRSTITQYCVRMYGADAVWYMNAAPFSFRAKNNSLAESACR